MKELKETHKCSYLQYKGKEINQTKRIIIILVVIKTLFPAKLNSSSHTHTIRNKKSAVNQLDLRRKTTFKQLRQHRQTLKKRRENINKSPIMT